MVFNCAFNNCNKYSRISIFRNDGFSSIYLDWLSKLGNKCSSRYFNCNFYFVQFFKRKNYNYYRFIKLKLGEKIALFYSLSNIALFSTVTLEQLFLGSLCSRNGLENNFLFYMKTESSE